MFDSGALFACLECCALCLCSQVVSRVVAQACQSLQRSLAVPTCCRPHKAGLWQGQTGWAAKWPCSEPQRVDGRMEGQMDRHLVWHCVGRSVYQACGSTILHCCMPGRGCHKSPSSLCKCSTRITPELSFQRPPTFCQPHIVVEAGGGAVCGETRVREVLACTWRVPPAFALLHCLLCFLFPRLRPLQAAF